MECKCRLRIFQLSIHRAVIIVSQIPDFPSRSISDEVITLMQSVSDRFSLSFNQTMWIEHYPFGYLKDDDVYEHVVIANGESVTSRRIKKEELEAIVQQEI